MEQIRNDQQALVAIAKKRLIDVILVLGSRHREVGLIDFFPARRKGDAAERRKSQTGGPSHFGICHVALTALRALTATWWSSINSVKGTDMEKHIFCM